MPGSHARRSSSTSTTGKRKSSKSRVFPICSPIDARWSPSVVPIRHWSATWSPASRSRTTTNWSIAVWSSSATSARDASSPSGATRLSPLATRPPSCTARCRKASRMSPTRPLRGTTLASMCASKTKTTAQIISSASANCSPATCSSISLRRSAIWLLAKVERNPEDARSVFFLAETYFHMEDFVNARKWYARRVEMGGCDEEAYWAMYRLAAVDGRNSVSRGQTVEEAYLRAWEFRPTRAEALYAIAFRYRVDAALPGRLPVCPARRRNPISRRGPLCPRRDRRGLRLARNR